MKGNWSDSFSQALGWGLLYGLLLLGNWLKHRWEVRKDKARHAFTPDVLNREFKSSAEIDIALAKALEDFAGADRAYFTRFHNGESYIDGSPIQRRTRTNERVRLGISRQAPLFRNILVLSVRQEVALVQKSLTEGPQWMLVDGLEEGELKAMLESAGVRSIVRCGVKRHENLIGFFGMDLSVDRPPLNLKDAIAVVDEILLALSGYLV